MSPKLLKIVTEGDEGELERAYDDYKYAFSFKVDWKEDDVETVAWCAKLLRLKSLTAERREEGLFIRFKSREVQVPLRGNSGDRHTTVCTVNDLLSPKYEVRFLVLSHGNDTVGFAALSIADWQKLERANANFVEENFIDPRKLPNVMTQLTDANFPPKARAKRERIQADNLARWRAS